MGSLDDLDSLDFYLYAEANNEMSEIIRNKVTDKFTAAVKNVDISIDEAQKKLDAAKEAYEALYLPAIEKLNKAQETADKYLDECVFCRQGERENLIPKLKIWRRMFKMPKKLLIMSFNKPKMQSTRQKKKIEQYNQKRRRKFGKGSEGIRRKYENSSRKRRKS